MECDIERDPINFVAIDILVRKIPDTFEFVIVNLIKMYWNTICTVKGINKVTRKNIILKSFYINQCRQK